MLLLLSQTLCLLGLATFVDNPGRASEMRPSGFFLDCSLSMAASESILGAALSPKPSLASITLVYLSVPTCGLRILSELPGIRADSGKATSDCEALAEL